MQDTPAKGETTDRWLKLRRWLLQRGVYWLLVAPYLLPIFGFKNGPIPLLLLFPLPLLAPFFFVYPINWALRRRTKRRGQELANVWVGYYLRTNDVLPLDSLTAELGWRTIRGRPRGTTLVGAWQSVITPATFLECIDEQDQSWYVIRNVTNRPTPRWLVGPALRCAARELGSPSTRFTFRLFERIGCHWIRMSKDELDMQLQEFDGIEANSPVVGWRCPDSSQVVIGLTDGEGRDYVVERKTNDSEPLWYFGFFFAYQKAWQRASDLLVAGSLAVP